MSRFAGRKHGHSQRISSGRVHAGVPMAQVFATRWNYQISNWILRYWLIISKSERFDVINSAPWRAPSNASPG
jgi:hypothetical protein